MILLEIEFRNTLPMDTIFYNSNNRWVTQLRIGFGNEFLNERADILKYLKADF
jgi:hypothetical protein